MINMFNNQLMMKLEMVYQQRKLPILILNTFYIMYIDWVIIIFPQAYFDNQYNLL